MTKEQILQELGLTERETKIYLTLLALGQTSVNSIAKKANMNRVTTYDILKYLQEKGLVSYVIKSGVKYFESAPPKALLGQLQEKQDKLKSILPELESLRQSLNAKPSVELYEGLSGLKTIFEDILKENKESWFIADPNLIDALEFYFSHFIRAKRKQGMFSKVLTADCKRMYTYKDKAPKKYLDMRFINQNLPASKIIYGNKVATLTFEKENSIGLIVENKQVADTERKLFGLIWGKAKKIKRGQLL